MKCYHSPDSVVVMKFTSHFVERLFQVQQCICCNFSEKQNKLWIYQFQLLFRYGSHRSISSGSGLRLPGGRHFKILQIKTSSRFNPIASSILFRNCPALPTKGSPCVLIGSRRFTYYYYISLGLPTPNTNFVRVFPNAHFSNYIFFHSADLNLQQIPIHP